MKKTQIIVYTIIGLLFLLWIPASLDKIIHFEAFKQGMLAQPFDDLLGILLAYTLPIAEIITVVLLVKRTTAKAGFLLSSVLMAAFTNYIGMALLLTENNLPCVCGSLLPKLGWRLHFFFNIIFLILSIAGYFSQRKYNRAIAARQPLPRAGRPKDDILTSISKS
ncbi:MauE/DoxX family redox-associated membrane protein [Sphingobacterium sp. LRF_L2]|uniref:MauE/DoxX family redox-associated membrane protein n=1 Tax=Sphingobacterium sp. LRF_L2 TaxID=3369421 RepID=UPI003F5E77A9